MPEVLYARALTRNGEVSAAWLLAFVDELTTAVGDGEGPRRGRAQRHRRQAALVFARASLAACTDRARDRRARWTGDLLARNADAIAAHFGPNGLGGRLSVVGQGVMAAWQHGHHGHSVPWAQGLLALAEAAEARGEAAVAADAHTRAAHALNELQPGAGQMGPCSSEAPTGSRSIPAARIDRTRTAP